MKTDITTYLEFAAPTFKYFINNMSYEIAQWIAYNGVEEYDNNVYFKFKSTQNSLNFRVRVTGNINHVYIFRAKTNEIYNYFKTLKYSIILKRRN